MSASTIWFTSDLKEVELPTDYNDLAFYSIRELAYLIKNKKITSQELTKIFLHRINKYNKKINAVVTLTDSVAFSQAKEADEEIASGIFRGPLQGIPYETLTRQQASGNQFMQQPSIYGQTIGGLGSLAALYKILGT